ncbi:amidohydrolase family protein [Pararhizobium sp. O133]|uniref:amidohydrolase family protein n=1 Tax=Pararhizobium sp. O133 TaxID=3449278 RepID=UPI003F688705
MTSSTVNISATRRPKGRVLMTARWVVGHRDGRHCLLQNGEIVFEDGMVIFVGHGFDGEVAERHDQGSAIVAPGFVDLDALADLDTTILALDNHPGVDKGRVWPRSYMEAGPFEMYDAEELAFQKRHAFATLIRNGITTALPVASLFYRAWGETAEEFSDAARAAAELGLRVYLGPAFRTGNLVVEEDGSITTHYDEARGLAELDRAIDFCHRYEGAAGGLIRTMFAPDRIETSAAALLRRTADAARALDVPTRLHCCQSKMEYDLVLARHGMSPPEWLQHLNFLGEKTLLPHGVFVSGSRHIARPGHDLEIIHDAGAVIVHCPLVFGRMSGAIDSFSRYRELGIRIGMGTDTSPPDMIANMQIGLILNRVLEARPDACRSEDFFDAATIGGADALGRPDLGRLQPGAAADMIVIDLGLPHHGQVIDPIQTLLVAGHGRDVRSVIIDGRFVMRDRVIPGIDEAADNARAQRQFDKLKSLYPKRTRGHPPVEKIFSSSYPIVA